MTSRPRGRSYATHVDATLSAALCPQRVRLASAFPLVDPLPSTDSAAAFGPALFARFFGTMGPSDSLETCMSDVRHNAFSDRPAPCGAGVSRVSRFPCIEFPRMHRVFRLRGVHERLAIGVAHDVAFPLSEQGRHAEEMISELNGWPAWWCRPRSCTLTPTPNRTCKFPSIRLSR